MGLGYDAIPSLGDLEDERPEVAAEIWAAATAQAYLETGKIPVHGSKSRLGWDCDYICTWPQDWAEASGWLAREIVGARESDGERCGRFR